MPTPADVAALAALARGLRGLDAACYARHGRDAAQPLLGLGRRAAPLCFVGRDPGESEIAQWRPFVGASGRKIREALAGRDEDVFWINTVPYKPQGNQAWPLAVRRAFHAVLFPLLLREWDGHAVVTFGSEAFHWFALGSSGEVRRQVEAFWAREDRFSASLELEFEAPGGGPRRQLVLHPLPHPSPANARWKQHFPGLLQARLARLLPAAG